MILLVCRVLEIRFSWDQASRMASESIHIRTGGKAGDCFCFVPGYHTNSKEDAEKYREDHFCGILYGIARNILAEKRPWYKHPRWHIHHWRLQIHPWQSFKRRFLDCRISLQGSAYKICRSRAFPPTSVPQAFRLRPFPVAFLPFARRVSFQ